MRNARRATISALIVTAIAIAVLSAGCDASKRAMKTVAIATLMTHPALDAVQDNLKKELARQGYVDGKNVRYIVRNANSQLGLAASIANELAAMKPDVTVAIATPMAQAVAKVARGPVVFAAVTDPVGAGLVASTDKGEKMITGTSDAWPYGAKLKLIRKISPKIGRAHV